MKEILIRVTAPHFVAGIIVYDNVTIRSAPILRWAERMYFVEFKNIAEKKKWTLEYIGT